MAFSPAKGGTTDDVQVSVAASNTVTAGGVLQFDLTNKGLKPATSSTQVSQIGFIANQALVSQGTAALINAIPILPDQLFIADCTNVTNANQLYIRQALTDANTVNNTSSDTAANTGVFYPIALKSDVNNKQLVGYLIATRQVT